MTKGHTCRTSAKVRTCGFWDIEQTERQTDITYRHADLNTLSALRGQSNNDNADDHTTTTTILWPSGFYLGLPGWASTRKVKPIWIYWSKRQWVAVVSAGSYAMLTPFDLLQGLPLRATHGFTSSPIVHTCRVPPCTAQSRLGAIMR